MIEIAIVFIIAGLVILYKFGIKPELEKRVNHVDLCDKHYKGDL